MKEFTYLIPRKYLRNFDKSMLEKGYGSKPAAAGKRSRKGKG